MGLKEQIYDCDDDDAILRALDEVAHENGWFVRETDKRTYEVRDLVHNIPVSPADLSLEDVIEFLE